MLHRLQCRPPQLPRRQLFVRELHRQRSENKVIHSLALRGTKLESAEMLRLTTLLTQHGVWHERANDSATAILTQIPPSTIRSVLASPRPWPDLKAAANSVRPQLRLIMPDELNAQIAQRTNQRKFGKS